MLTVSVGSAVIVVITNGPVPGMSNVMGEPGLTLASRIAWRSEPTPLSFVLVTTKGEASAAAVAKADVLLFGSVAVAVTCWPLASGAAKLNVAAKPCVADVRAGVVTVPRNWAAGPPRLALA